MSIPAIEIRDLSLRYDRTEAVHGLSLTVERGRCYGFFGRNGAGKTTTLKCLLNLLRPQRGTIRVFGLDPVREEVAVKARLAYVPDFVSFYPWMRVGEALDYLASFRPRWNPDLEKRLLKRFQLDPAAPTSGLSKGQRTQLALIGAIAAEPELLVLDEPTSGLDPLIRREFIQTVIGAYQDADPGERTVLVSTHLISEFEGLIDRFTILDGGKAVMTADADEADRGSCACGRSSPKTRRRTRPCPGRAPFVARAGRSKCCWTATTARSVSAWNTWAAATSR